MNWRNELSGHELALGGSELEIEVGDTPEQSQRLAMELAAPAEASADAEQAVLAVKSRDGRLAGRIVYRRNPRDPLLHKYVELTNTSDGPVRVLNVVLGRYPAQGRFEGGERGFPLYVDGQFFISLVHPAGYAHIEQAEIVLRQYPGARLAPGETLKCMEAVYGVARPGEARVTFIEHVRGRMRRVVRGHRGPYAVLEAFGGQPDGDFFCKEQYLLDHLARVEHSLREGGPRFDFYCTEFWHDAAGDLTDFHPQNFPRGYARVRDEILRLGMKPGLWIDSGGLPAWTIGQNPAIQRCFTQGEGKGELCRASEPINSMYKQAFIHHVRENKVGLLKFDNLGPACQAPCCNNPAHDHLPGPLYSVEAIYNAVIDFLRELDAACPDVFLMLYWGYRSPWWLLHGDTYFESGAHIEGASATGFPAPFARDSVTHRLDQAQWGIVDTPWLGKDSLGVWLSDWPWNSCVGKARWQEGLIMDLCRGSLLAQIWTDTQFLTPPERSQLADFLALLKANPKCFDGSRFVIGDPLKRGPYGYYCSDGHRAFLAIHNAQLADGIVPLDLSGGGRLPGDGPWDVYRCYPNPARLVSEQQSWGREAKIALRPHEVVLIEIVPAGESPSLGRIPVSAPMPTAFAEPTQRLPLVAHATQPAPEPETAWQPLRPSSAMAGSATLSVREDDSILAGGANVTGDVYTIVAPASATRVSAVLLEALSDPSLPGGGPGRAENGNHALTAFRLFVHHGEKLEERPVALRSARADFSQTSHGGWPAEAALDENPASGWSIHPHIGIPHAAVFELETPLDLATGDSLVFRLTQGERGHALGRLRLSVTGDASAMLPPDYRGSEYLLRTTVPASRCGGLLLISGGEEMSPPRATFEDREVGLTSVWSDRAYWKAPWKAWRAELAAGQSRRVSIGVNMGPGGQAEQVEVHWIPRD